MLCFELKQRRIKVNANDEFVDGRVFEFQRFMVSLTHWSLVQPSRILKTL